MKIKMIAPSKEQETMRAMSNFSCESNRCFLPPTESPAQPKVRNFIENLARAHNSSTNVRSFCDGPQNQSTKPKSQENEEQSGHSLIAAAFSYPFRRTFGNSIREKRWITSFTEYLERKQPLKWKLERREEKEERYEEQLTWRTEVGHSSLHKSKQES